MDAPSFLEARLDRGAVPLAVGDLIALIVLLTVGALNHTSVEFLSSNPLYLLEVYAPFLIAWVLVAPLVGAYSAGAVETAKSSVPLVIRSWIPAAILGLALRAFVFRGGAALTFAVVMLVLGSVALGGWRALYFKLR
jgi:FlaA1/EpsC-like NDP-sugar epimerase